MGVRLERLQGSEKELHSDGRHLPCHNLFTTCSELVVIGDGDPHYEVWSPITRLSTTTVSIGLWWWKPCT